MSIDTTDLELTSQFVDDILRSRGDMQPYLKKVSDARAMLKDVQPRKNKPHPKASELVVPYVKTTKFALVSHLTPVLLNPDPIFHVNGTDADSKEMADKYQNYQQEQLTRIMRFRATGKKLIDCSLRDGFVVARITWFKDNKSLFRFKGGKKAKEDVLIYDAPLIDIIPVDKCGSFPAANINPQESRGWWEYTTMTGEEIMRFVDAKKFDKATVEAFKNTPGDQDAHDTATNEMHEITDSSTVSQSFLSTSYKVTWLYWRKDDGTDWQYYIHEKTATMLGAHENPWFDGERPYEIITPYGDAEGIYGESVASSGAGHTQTALISLVRLVLDAIETGIFPPMAVAAGLSKQIVDIKSFRTPGGVIPFPDAFWENGSNAKMTPFTNGGFSPNIAFDVINWVLDNGNENSGVNDAMKGVPNPGNVTATEAQQIIDGSMKIVGFIAENIAEAFDRIGAKLFSRNYQFQHNEGPQKLWVELFGKPPKKPNPLERMAQKIGIMPQKDEPDYFSLSNVMEGTYNISCNGVRDTSNRAIQSKRVNEIYTLLMKNPFYQKLTEAKPELMFNLLAKVLQSNGEASLDKILADLDVWKEVFAPQPPSLPINSADGSGQVAGVDVSQQGIPPGGPPSPAGGQPYTPDVANQLSQQTGIPPDKIMQIGQQAGWPDPHIFVEEIQQAMQGQPAPQQGGM